MVIARVEIRLCGDARVEREMKFVGETLRGAKRDQLQPRVVISRGEGRSRFAADVARVRVGDESFRPAARRDEAMSVSVGARLLRHEKNHRARIPRRVAGIPDLSDFPLAPDLKRDLIGRVLSDVGKGDDSYLATRFVTHVGGNRLDTADRRRLKNVREIVDEPGRRGNVNCLQQSEQSRPENCQLRYDVDRSSALALDVMQASIYRMLPTRVNYAAAIVFVSLACAPASSSTRGAETASSSPVTSDASASKQYSPPSQDPDVNRADLARIAGNSAAKTWVIVVSDFQCPFCKQWHDETYATFRDEYVKTGKVRFAYINYPLNSHQNAWPAAQSAMCAGAQDKFWPMHEALFATQQQWEVMTPPTPFLDSLARAQAGHEAIHGLRLQRKK